MKFIVTEKSQRQSQRTREECRYCHQPLGSDHKNDCILIKKKVKIRMTVEYEIEVPSDWDKEMVEFSRNSGSWCAGNAIAELDELAGDNGCLCHCASFEYIDTVSEPYLKEE